ncbi:MAG: putative porin [Desulfarculaceae bacterium]|nr:putative porin [Desulfarculaceae bacterium]MCF8074261.1 putative porin [Desulfarculaceae bacterium]MCF8102980.1 putative porin [Desulfarculaceae bacterium]MCF8117111.1 putative porin [Desulfarculaceae bacterium]
MRRVVSVLALLVGLSLFAAPYAAAATSADLEAKIKAMEQQLQSMKQQLKQVQTTQQQQAVDVAAKSKLPSWLERMTFFGDVRFRYEHTSYDDTDLQGVNTSKDGKDRFRVRLRFGVRSQIHDDVEVGLRMATGSDDDPTSTNQTMGNYFGEIQSWGVDQVYVKYTPSYLPQKMGTFSFGKVPQPFVTSKIIWDSDVVPEGAFLNFTFNKTGGVQPFVTGAYMTVSQPGEFGDNVLAPALQAGAKAKFGAFKLTGAAGYTSWGDLGDNGHLPPNLHGTPTYSEGGSLRTTNYGVVDVYAKGAFKFSKKGSVGLWGHYLTNQDSDGPYQNKDTGYGGAAFVTYDKFKFEVLYKNVEANASPGFIADSDSSYVNRKGWQVEAQYKMWKYGKLVLTYYNTEPEDADIPGATNKSQTIFVNTIFKF